MHIEPLGTQERSRFASGQPEMDDWFRHRAGQDQRRGLARVFVAVDDSLGVVGFYSVSSWALRLRDLPPDIGRKLPRYPLVPAILIGRLARDERVRGQRIGDFLLGDAIVRIVRAADSVGTFAIAVEAKDESAAALYLRFAFRRLPEAPLSLYLPMSIAVASVAQSLTPP